ncbi:DUF4149 domain-containing protein [Actinoallomurus iriomotensis]|uniref:Transmembrane protein n=1 Tax=Actinoallomurus iriomotensis TaxID=478107 RepID=A0A9W6SAT0_9ACTN|nr:DUF4149 domain-containing protein [Actinoallomurus iriomotensis]GLY90179.1 hypothetical protein Airi02_081080 [Actinoallomurus iriomotensis]
MSTAPAIATAVTFVWLGMVLAISFLEAPLKFRAPDVTLRVGLGIGRIVFRALNAVEAVLAVVLVVALAVDRPDTAGLVTLIVAVVVLLVQLVAVRPRLTRRSDAVLSGADAPRSHAHHVYIALESLKVLALLIGGIVLLSGSQP